VRVLGIDPGSAVTGWGVVEASPLGIRYLASGTISTRGCGSFAARLHRICDRVRALARQWAPQAAGLERAFVARNVQAAFRLGEARGAVLVGLAAEGVEIHEYAPAAVKLAVAGFGRADKEQVGRGIARLLRVNGAMPRDASDALAVALCHLHGARFAERVRHATDGARGDRSDPRRPSAAGVSGPVRARRSVRVRPPGGNAGMSGGGA
jgi:crossover junction endodeoxyribonuclease RuvC